MFGCSRQKNQYHRKNKVLSNCWWWILAMDCKIEILLRYYRDSWTRFKLASWTRFKLAQCKIFWLHFSLSRLYNWIPEIISKHYDVRNISCGKTHTHTHYYVVCLFTIILQYFSSSNKRKPVESYIHHWYSRIDNGRHCSHRSVLS